MSTTVGNGLTVDGTVKASQATQAGEAVVLGDDGLIPANLVSSGGSSNAAMLPHFIATSYKSIKINGLESTALSASKTNKHLSSEFSKDALLFRYGSISMRVRAASGNAAACKHSCSIKLSDYASQLNGLIDELIPSIRTNLRGNFTISGSLLDYGEIYDFTFSVTISDDGIEVISYPPWPTTSVDLYYTTSFTSSTINMYFTGIDNSDEGWY